MNKVVVLGGLAAAGYLAYKLAVVDNTVKQLTISFAGVKYNKQNSNLLKTTLEIKISVLNPTITPVQFDGFSGSLFINGTQFATITKTKENTGFISLKANGSTDITFMTTVSNLNLITNGAAIIKSLATGGAGLHITMVGSLNAGGVQIPITQETAINIGCPCDEQQVSGIGKVTAKLEFNNNEELADYYKNLQFMPRHTNGTYKKKR